MPFFRLRPAAPAALALALAAACSSQNDAIDTPVVRPASVAPAGIYAGTLTRDDVAQDVTAFIDGDESFMLFDADGTLIASGVYSKIDAARSLNWTARLFTVRTTPSEEPDDPDTPDVDESAPVTAQVITTLVAGGTYEEEASIQMTFTERDTGGDVIGSGTLELVYDDIAYESRSDVSLIQGEWGVKDTFGTPVLSIGVGADGGFSGADEDGCAYNGSLTVLDQHYNLYGFSLRTQCPGSASAVTTTGLATLKKAAVTSATPVLQSVSASSKLAVLWQLKPL